jgi:hypothetical protein
MDITDPVVTNAIEVARKNVRESDEFVPVWFVGGKDGGLNIVATPFVGPDEHATKDAVVVAVKKIAAGCDAEFILFISECWTLAGDKEATEEYMNHRERFPNGLADHPKRREAILVNLHTHDGVRLGMADILPGRVMGEVNWHESDVKMAGRFAKMLPPRSPSREAVKETHT